MALSHAILSLLSRGPASGYDLLKSFEGSVANFWYASHPQIYKELAALEKRGLVARRLVIQHGRPNKKVFRITEAGEKELREWVSGPIQSEHHNSSTALRAFSLHTLGPAEALAKVEEMERAAREEMRRYREIEKILASAALSGDRATQSSYLSLLFGMSYAEGYLRWCERARALLQQSTPSHRGRR